MLLTVRREQLLGPDVPDGDALLDLDARLLQVLIRAVLATPPSTPTTDRG